jgi:hypothetical protein
MHDRSRWWNLNNPYGYRDENLLRMGFSSYRAYLKSELWKDIRARVLARAPDGLCEKCKRAPATQVHHRSYDPATLAGTTIDSLTKTCARCHTKAERPDDRGQTRYDRYKNSSTFLLGGKQTREKEIRQAKRYWSKGPK